MQKYIHEIFLKVAL